MKISRRFLTFLALATLAGIAIWTIGLIPNPETPENKATSAANPAAPKTAPQPPAPLALDANLPPAARELAPLMAAPLAIRDGGSIREFQVSTTEVSVRGRDGSKQIATLPPPGSPEGFAAELEKLRTAHGSEPELVLYPVGFPRNEYTRRIATREVVITAPSRSKADALAAAQGLVFKKAPVFAPNSFVYEAPTSAKALSVQADQSTALEATPLLASRRGVMAMPNDPYIQLQWHLKYQSQQGAVQGTDINVEKVWNYPSTSPSDSIRGRGVVIGIVDDGMEWNHPDLRPNVLPDLQWDWNGNDNDPTPDFFKVDENGDPDPDNHGTACAGVSAARGNNRIGVSGVAPEAGIAGMRLISGYSTDLDEAEAMTWKIGAIDILSNSWGSRAFARDDKGMFAGWYRLRQNGALLEAALKYAVDYGRGGRGTIITFAAGNDDEFSVDDGNGTITTQNSGARMDFSDLQSSTYTIAVGAVNSVGVKSNYSQIGAGLLVSAPSNTTDDSGLGIMTTDNKGRYGYNEGISGVDIYDRPDFASSGDVTKNFGGTSSACPVVSGVIALMLEKNPALGWRDVQEILMRSATRVDAGDSDWITANRTSHVPGQPLVPFQFNHKYGAGLVNADAAVRLSGNWTNLGPQQSKVVARNLTQRIPATAAAVRRTFTVNGTNLRTEHATLELTITEIPKGDLTITLTSPGNTTSTFCLPHSDRANGVDLSGNLTGFVDQNSNGTFDPGEPSWRPNRLTNWKFMTVRNWGENSNGVWQLAVTNNGTLTGNLTRAVLTVYGTAAANATTLVTASANSTLASIGSNITLNATATARSANGTLSGNITGVQFFLTTNGTGNATLIGNGTLSPNSPSNPATFSVVWNTANGTLSGNNTANLAAGNYSITAVARSSGNVTGTSAAVPVVLEAPLLAGWDFQTATLSTVPLTTVLYGTRTYRANFGNGTMFMNGGNQSSRWDVAAGEVFSGEGTTENAQPGFSRTATNPAALLLRGGRGLSANGKSIVFQIDMSNSRRLDISYAARATAGGFNQHTWDYYDATARTWRRIDQKSIPPTPTFSTVSVAQVPGNGFNGRPNALVRLTVSGAPSITGTNLIDNVSFKASRAP